MVEKIGAIVCAIFAITAFIYQHFKIDPENKRLQKISRNILILSLSISIICSFLVYISYKTVESDQVSNNNKFQKVTQNTHDDNLSLNHQNLPPLTSNDNSKINNSTNIVDSNKVMSDIDSSRNGSSSGGKTGTTKKKYIPKNKHRKIEVIKWVPPPTFNPSEFKKK